MRRTVQERSTNSAQSSKSTREQSAQRPSPETHGHEREHPSLATAPPHTPCSSLLITLAILRALAIECRRDISLLSPFLLSCLKITLGLVSSDLEIAARAASVVRTSPVTPRPPNRLQLTAWCTYTDGHAIGVDADMTQNYLVVLAHFAKQSTTEIKSVDYELRNR
jgi:hypothetical protein